MKRQRRNSRAGGLRFLILAVAFLIFQTLSAQSFQIQRINNDAEIHSLDNDSSSSSTWWVTYQKLSPDPSSLAELEKTEENDSAQAGWFPVRVPENLLKNLKPSEWKDEAWYRKTIILPESINGHLALRLAVITDIDCAYFNGHPIGCTGNWSSTEAQGYDKIRLYQIPDEYVRKAERNTIVVHVRRFFPYELGINKDFTAIGPSEMLRMQLVHADYLQLTVLAGYLTLGVFFLFLFARRRKDKENLYFAATCFLLVTYQFLRTQIKYEFAPLSFLDLKRIEYAVFFATPLPFVLFVVSFVNLPRNRLVRIVHWILGITMAAMTCCIPVVFFQSPQLWNTINRSFFQPVAFPIFGSYMIGALIYNSLKKESRDSLYLLTSAIVVAIAVFVDILSANIIINLPRVTGYAFGLFVFSISIILANKLVRLQEESELTSKNLQILNQAFHRFVPTQFLEFLNKKSVIDINLGDSALYEMSVLFSDIRSFTTLSERMNPADSFRFLNSYLKRMEPIIKRNQGFVDKYLGDGIMSLYPETPMNSETSADRAVRSAIEMQHELRRYNAHRVHTGYAPISIGTGIHTGGLMLGTVGSAERLDTTVIGDTVNLAARLESLTSYYGVRIVISDKSLYSLRAMQDATHREIDFVQVKGKKEPVRVFEIFGFEDDPITESKLRTLGALDAAVRMFRAGDFISALRLFEELDKSYESDHIPRLYVERCRRFSIAAPDNWTGIVELTGK